MAQHMLLVTSLLLIHSLWWFGPFGLFAAWTILTLTVCLSRLI